MPFSDNVNRLQDISCLQRSVGSCIYGIMFIFHFFTPCLFRKIASGGGKMKILIIVDEKYLFDISILSVIWFATNVLYAYVLIILFLAIKKFCLGKHVALSDFIFHSVFIFIFIVLHMYTKLDFISMAVATIVYLLGRYPKLKF